MRRLATIVLDSAERSFVRQLARDGHLPVIAGLLERGALCPVQTSVAYRAESADTELLSGSPAATSRYWSTVVFDPATYSCTTVGSALRAPFYAIRPAGRVLTFDIPHSVLVEDLAGVQIVGWGGHDSRFFYPRASVPAGLLHEIDTRFGPDPTVAVEYSGSWHQEPYIHALADALISSSRRRADIAIWLLGRFPDWELFMMGMTELHSAGHNFCHGLDERHLLGTHPTAAIARERFVDVYRAVDHAVGRIADAIPSETTLALVAAKGMQPNRDDVASGMLLPELLHRQTFGRALLHEPTHRAWQRDGHPPVWPDPHRRASDRLGMLVAEGRLARLKRLYHTSAPRGVVRTGQRLRRAAGRARQSSSDFSSTVPGVLPDGTQPALPGSIDWHPAMLYRHLWPLMPWFVLPSFSDGHVRLNLRGRERQGVVPLDAYGRVCDELEELLRAATDPRSGQPVVDQVLRLRVDEPLAPDGPGADLVVTWRAPADALVHPDAGVVGPFAFPRSGSHTPNGFLLVVGDVVPQVIVDARPALDVPPTLLTLLEWPVPPDLAGDPIPGLTDSTVVS